MLSPGDYHLSVPRDPEANLRYRLKLLRLCRERPEYRRAVVEMCRQDIRFFVNCFVWQYNPKRVGSEVEPFVLWDFQGDLLDRTMHRLFVQQRRSLWEKSREMGATWLALILFDWACLFHRDKSFFTISHSEEAVDKAGKRNTLYWKVQFVHDHLPDWLLRGARKRRLSFEYPATRSSMEGGATSERSGVGGRNTALLLDEFSKHTKDREILGQTADTGPCLIIGTHYGVGSAFYDLTQRPDEQKEVIHWSLHPEKRKGLYESYPDSNAIKVIDTTYEYPPDFEFVRGGNASGGGPYPFLRSPWYDAQCKERANVRDVAQHLDINPSGSQSQFFDPLQINKLVASCVDPWEGDLDYDPDGATPVKLRPEPGGPLKLWVVPTGDCAVPPSKYGMGVDCSAGTGRTNSVISVGDAATGIKVAEYATPFLPPERLAPVAVALCRLFADESGQGALLNWEDKGPGLAFGRTLGQLGYRRLWPREGASLVRGKAQVTLYGWSPGTDNKRRLMDQYRGALYDRAFVNLSKLALEECLNYRYSDRRDAVEHPRDIDGDDPSGAKSNHGDRVIADAVMWLALVKLGAGVPGKPVAAALTPSAVGSLEWRMELAESRDRQRSDRRPIQRSSRVRA